MSTQFPEKYIQDLFHGYLKSSLTQAKIEHLVDADLLSSAEGDLMITGPALCLYFAALRCTTNPPSVPLPRSSKSELSLELSVDNCPPAFRSFLNVWSRTVPDIQNLAPEHLHDLARIICGLNAIMSPVHPAIHGIAEDLRAVAIEISQRRSFQDRYASDLQAVLDSGHDNVAKKASYVPPPTYEASPPPSSAGSSPHLYCNKSLPPSPQLATYDLPPQSPSHLSPYKRDQRSPSPSILTPDSPAIEFIRETLYASLADSLDRTPSLCQLLKHDPSRAYFASVAYALLDVATTSVTSEGSILGVLGQALTLEECPHELRPFMVELAAIGRQATQFDEEDTSLAITYAQQGRNIPPTKLDCVRQFLERGVGHDLTRLASRNERRTSLQGRALGFANRINTLSMQLTRLKAFRDRQEQVFKVLAGVGQS